ncbi:MAG: GNAT family N-acetyltransferase [Actinobacteria bacterium]|nr:GNAT family N-acetyltransferase [Actinomycetota bacterium]
MAGEQDIAPYRRAVEASRQRLARWNPVDPDDLARQLPLQSRDRRTFLVHALTPESDHDIVGKINVSDVVRGRLESAVVGYDAYDPYAGRGLFAEGMRLVLDLAFAPEAAGGMGLHRVAAAVQPGNVRSAGLLRSLGFQREGFSPRMLWLPGPDGNHAWLDHVCYVVLRDEWPTRPYAPSRGRKVIVLVNGAAGSGTTALARQLAAELCIPLFSGDVIQGSVAGAMWALLEDSPVGGVAESRFRPEDAPLVVEGLMRAGMDPATVPEVWCFSADVEASARPLGLGPTVAVDTGHGVGRADLVRIALQVCEGLLPASEI